jgi:50S ribosomal subunit-associated GTPase HflX
MSGVLLLQIVGSTYQVLESPNPATYIGSGKVAEVAAAVQAAKVNMTPWLLSRSQKPNSHNL